MPVLPQGTVEIKIIMNAGNSRQVQQQMVGQYRALERSVRKTAKSTAFLGTSMRKLGRSALFGLASFASVTAVVGGLKSIGTHFKGIADNQREFSNALTPLLSLGDNIENIRATGAAVDQLMLVARVGADNAAGALFNLKSSTSNLSETIREDLKKEIVELVDVTGGDLRIATNLMTKSWIIYKDELDSVNQLQNKLLKTQSDASLEFEDLATLLPQVAQAAKGFGITFDELLGAIVGGTQASGNLVKTFTGLRNIFVIMEQAQEKGVKFSGDFNEKLQQMDKLFEKNRKKAVKLFGREVVVNALNFADAIDHIAASTEEFASIAATADEAARKLFLRSATDPVARRVRTDERTGIERQRLIRGAGGAGFAGFGARMDVGLMTRHPSTASLPAWLRGAVNWTNFILNPTGASALVSEGQASIISRLPGPERAALDLVQKQEARDRAILGDAARLSRLDKRIEELDPSHDTAAEGFQGSRSGARRRRESLVLQRERERIGGRDRQRDFETQIETGSRPGFKELPPSDGGGSESSDRNTLALEENTAALKDLAKKSPPAPQAAAPLPIGE